MTSVHALIIQLTQRLCSPLISNTLAQQEAWWMLEALTGMSKVALSAVRTIDLSVKQQQQLDEWVAQRVELKKPLQYILGSVPFCDLTIHVRPPILIPRPETEEWTMWLIDELKKHEAHSLRILDLCSGSGCIGLALAHHISQAAVIGVDINADAILLAQENKAFNNIENIQFVESDLYTKLEGMKFDLIVSNPPYLSSFEYEAIGDDVKFWEDPKALVALDRGMQLYHQIIAQARVYLDSNSSLKKIPALVCEIGPAQEDSIEVLLKDYGFENIQLFRDLQGVSRWVIAYI